MVVLPYGHGYEFQDVSFWTSVYHKYRMNRAFCEYSCGPNARSLNKIAFHIVDTAILLAWRDHESPYGVAEGSSV